jgi:hypothetical protein
VVVQLVARVDLAGDDLLAAARPPGRAEPAHGPATGLRPAEGSPYAGPGADAGAVKAFTTTAPTR